MNTLTPEWSRWTEIVELFARRRPARHRVDPRSYAALHKALLVACRELAASGEESSRAFYGQLEDLIQPFLTPRVLAQTEREILSDLLVRCREVEVVLRGRTWTRAAGRRAAAGFLAALLGASAFLLIWVACGSLPALWHQVQTYSDVVWITINRANDVERMIALGVTLVVASVVILSRTARS